MVAAGATWLDVGGESSRPGAAPISAAAEIARVIPVVAGLRRRLDAMLGLERIHFGTRFQPAVVDDETAALQQMFCLEAIGAGVPRHDHAMEGCLAFHAPHIAPVPWYGVKRW